MLIVNPDQLMALKLDRPWLCDKEKLGVNQVLAVMRGDKAETLAARHISDGVVGWTKPNKIQDLLALTVATRSQEPFDVFFDEEHYRRPATQAGAMTIWDFRRSGYADLRRHEVDNTVIFIQRASIDSLADELRVPRSETVRTLFEENQVDSTVLSLVEVMKLALERPKEANQYVLEHILGAMISHVAFHYCDMQKPSLQRRGALTSPQERRVKNQLREQLAEPPTLQEMASSCGLSRSHFSRAFREATGLPPHRWLLAERVSRAKALLQETRKPITEIALECGFADQSHLTRVFSKAVSLSPAAWRRQKWS